MDEASAAPGSASLTATGNGGYALRGALTFATARAVHDQGRRVITAGGGGAAVSGAVDTAAPGARPRVLEFDCSGLTHTDSAGVAVLIVWLALARRRGLRLRYAGVSDAVRAIARISEVDDLLESGV